VTFPPQFLPAGEPASPRSLALMAIFALVYALLAFGARLALARH
jgi:hypothetical protein